MTHAGCTPRDAYEFHSVKQAKQLGPLLTRLSKAGWEVAIDAPHETDKEDEDGESWKAKGRGPWLVSARREECGCLCVKCGKPVNAAKEVEA